MVQTKAPLGFSGQIPTSRSFSVPMAPVELLPLLALYREQDSNVLVATGKEGSSQTTSRKWAGLYQPGLGAEGSKVTGHPGLPGTKRFPGRRGFQLENWDHPGKTKMSWWL